MRKFNVRELYSEGEEIFEGCVVPSGVVVDVDYQGDIEQIDLTYYYKDEKILEDYGGVECLPLDVPGTCLELMKVLVPVAFRKIEEIIRNRGE